MPYLLNAPYADLHLQIGWVFAPICAITLVFVWFMVPECKGKSLEQIDHLFQEGVPIRKFGSTDFADVYAEEEGDRDTKLVTEVEMVESK